MADVDHLGALGVAQLLERAAEIFRRDPKRRGSCVHLGGAGRLLVTGDLHDNPTHFVKVVNYARLEQPENNVILHELIHGERLTHGADMSWRMLANHELAQAFNQPVSKGAGENTELFREGLLCSFGDEAEIVDAAIGVFVRALPLAVRTQNGILCSHSLPSLYDMKTFDSGILDRDLVEDDYEVRIGSAWQMTWGRNQKPEQLAALAAAWGVKVFIAGHAAVPEGVLAAGPQFLLLNSDHEHGAVLPLMLGNEVSNAQELACGAIPLGSIEGSLGE